MYFRKSGQGKTLVFLHGWGCDGNVFEPIVSRLDDFCCYRVDFNGFGNSPNPPKSGWSVEDYAYNLFVFFRQHNIEKATLVGHSFGCRVALVFAAKYPELVDKMLLVAPAGLRKPSFLRWWKVKKYKAMRFLRSVGVKKANVVHCGSADYRAVSPEMKNTLVKVVNQDLTPFAKRVKCPVVIVNGKDDAETPLSHAKKLSKLVRGHLVVTEGGHFAFFENPRAFADTVRCLESDS